MKCGLARDILKCTICKEHLPLEPRPIFQFNRNSRILIIGQAPGQVTHDSGTPWDDKSGERLREWFGITKKQFYNPSLFALVPMGFCFPGRGKSGDLPPRPECSEKWMDPVRKYLKNIQLEIYIGKYACDRHFDKYKNLTTLIKDQAEVDDNRIVIPHPSPRNNIWLDKNPWFEKEILKDIQNKVRKELNR